MFRKVCLLLTAVLALADSSCYQTCLDNMGCNEDSCVDVWANCCLEHGCQWTRRCTPRQFMKAEVRGTCKVKNGEWEDGQIVCDDPYVLNLGINQINDFDCVNGQIRWQYDASTSTGTIIPSFPICSEFGAIANTGEDEYPPTWDLCEYLDCFDGDEFKSHDDNCVTHCKAFNQNGLRADTGRCCEGEVLERQCVQTPRSTENQCRWKGCGWRWLCSEGATPRVWISYDSMKAKYEETNNNDKKDYYSCVDHNCANEDYTGTESQRNGKVCERCYKSLVDSGVSWPSNVPNEGSGTCSQFTYTFCSGETYDKMKAKYEDNPSDAATDYTACVTANCAYKHYGSTFTGTSTELNELVCDRCHKSLLYADGVTRPNSIPATCNISC